MDQPSPEHSLLPFPKCLVKSELRVKTIFPSRFLSATYIFDSLIMALQGQASDARHLIERIRLEHTPEGHSKLSSIIRDALDMYVNPN